MDSLSIAMKEYQSLQSRKWREIKQEILVVILGTLILGGWVGLGIFYLENPRQILGLLSSYVAAKAIFLFFIPYSLYSVLIRWMDASKEVFIAKAMLLRFLFIEYPFEHSELIREIKDLKQFKKEINNLLLFHVLTAFLIALFFLGLADLSGFIGAEKTGDINGFDSLLSIVLFWLQVVRILSVASSLVTIIRNILKQRPVL